MARYALQTPPRVAHANRLGQKWAHPSQVVVLTDTKHHLGIGRQWDTYLYITFTPLWQHFASKVKKADNTKMKNAPTSINSGLIIRLSPGSDDWYGSRLLLAGVRSCLAPEASVQTRSPPLIWYCGHILHTKVKNRMHQNGESTLASTVTDECVQATDSLETY